MSSDEGALSRARTDLTGVVRSFRFAVPAALLTAGFAARGATLSPDAEVWERIVFAVAGSLGGALLLGVVVFAVLVATAPVRQRDEARAALAPAEENPNLLARQFATWLVAKRAALPRRPDSDFRP